MKLDVRPEAAARPDAKPDAKLPPDASVASGAATAERCDTYLFILLDCCGATSRPAVDDEAAADLGATPPAA